MLYPFGAVRFIVIAVSHRGDTPMRGKAYHRFGYGNMRDYPLADDKYAIEQLARRYSFINGKKVGIYGHSGGGFMAAAASVLIRTFIKLLSPVPEIMITISIIVGGENAITV